MERIGLGVARGRHREHASTRRSRIARARPASRRSSARRSRSAARAAASRTTATSSRRSCAAGSTESPTSQVLIERTLIGWKEFELEVMRDHDDNVVIVCSIENLDPMGVHTGDSITVAPAMTLTDREYQTMRDAAVAIIREVGVDAGGCNIQFADQSARRRDARDRDEPARVAVVGARVEGDRLPDRAHRRQARRRLSSRRDPERHHEDDAGVVRAGARLRRREVPALRVREIPDGEPASHDADEVASASRWRSAARSRKRFRRRCARSRSAVPAGRPAPRSIDDRLHDDTIETLRGALRQPTPERIFQVKRALERGIRSTRSTS